VWFFSRLFSFNISSSARLIWHPSAPFFVCDHWRACVPGRAQVLYYLGGKIEATQVTSFLLYTPHTEWWWGCGPLLPFLQEIHQVQQHFQFTPRMYKL
jgi:hypothetical protein